MPYVKIRFSADGNKILFNRVQKMKIQDATKLTY